MLSPLILPRLGMVKNCRCCCLVRAQNKAAFFQRPFRRLQSSKRKANSRLKDSQHLQEMAKSHIRNIGIIAHIDAGKTTTTERMLFASGFIRQAGSVDSGDTVMDFLPQERERGITISSAMISFPWKEHRINLIDTPGHVDFTLEVERSLLALDAVVVILDASKGVQAQTQTVWRQATKFGLPALIFLNKMDKPAADVTKCVTQLRKKLGLRPVSLQVSSGGTRFHSLLPASKEDSKDVEVHRQAMYEALAECDDDFAEVYLESTGENIPKEKRTIDDELVHSTIRQLTLNRQIAPVLMGSAMQSIGIKELLDAVIAYLPDPLSITKSIINQRLSSATPGFYGLAFRNIHDKYRGLLTFIRIYRGTLKPGSTIFNLNKARREKVGKVMEAYADELREVSVGTEGNVVVVSGLTSTITGDTLTTQTPSSQADADQVSLMPIVQIPDPVYFCSLEAHSPSQQQALEDALAIIQKEDPSLKVSMEADMGQLVVSGMGELHLEVIRARLKDQFGLEAYMGPLQVAYKEAPTITADYTHQVSRDVQGTSQSVTLHLRLVPASDHGPFKRLKVVPSQDDSWNANMVTRDVLHAVENGVKAGLSNGPSLGCPVVDVAVELLKLTTSRGVLPAMVSATATQCIQHLLRQANCQVMEPLMSLAISVPMYLVHEVIGDLSKRRAQMRDVEVVDEETRTVHAETPLAEMLHFSRDMRTVTHGMASLEVQFSRYQPVTADQCHALQSRVL